MKNKQIIMCWEKLHTISICSNGLKQFIQNRIKNLPHIGPTSEFISIFEINCIGKTSTITYGLLSTDDKDSWDRQTCGFVLSSNINPYDMAVMNGLDGTICLVVKKNEDKLTITTIGFETFHKCDEIEIPEYIKKATVQF